MPQSLTNFDAALKDDYGPGLRESVNSANPVWSEISTNEEDIQGRQAVWSVHTGRSTSTGARGELAALPTADRQRFQQVRDNLAYLYHTIKVSGPAQALTKNDSGSFTRALEYELKGAEKDLKNDCSRQSYNAAVSISSTLYLGSLTGTASTAGTTTTQTFGSADRAELRAVFVNEAIDIINGSTGVSRGTTIVTANNLTTKVVTFAPAVAGATTGDYIARQGNFQAATAAGGEMNGLRHLIHDTQVYANLDPATEPQWAAKTNGTTSTPISEVLLERSKEIVQTEGDGSTPDLWLAEHSQVTKLAQDLQARKRYDVSTEKLPAGWEGVKLTVGTLVKDRFNPDSYIFGITKSEISRFVGLDFTWDDDDGRVLYKALDNSDAVEARFKAYQNLNVTNRNSHVFVRVSTPTF